MEEGIYHLVENGSKVDIDDQLVFSTNLLSLFVNIESYTCPW